MYSQTCIKRTLKWTWKCVLYEQLSFIYRLKLYALSINREQETTVPFIDRDLLNRRAP
jgi:hypothetical protein